MIIYEKMLEGKEKPLFKVTNPEDPENPYIKDTATGCWIIITKVVNF